jgi:hypothetical protein
MRRRTPSPPHFAFVAVNSPLTFIGCTLTVPAIFSAESSVVSETASAD